MLASLISFHQGSRMMLTPDVSHHMMHAVQMRHTRLLDDLRTLLQASPRPIPFAASSSPVQTHLPISLHLLYRCRLFRTCSRSPLCAPSSQDAYWNADQGVGAVFSHGYSRSQDPALLNVTHRETSSWPCFWEISRSYPLCHSRACKGSSRARKMSEGGGVCT
jgi:hypothetical protein